MSDSVKVENVEDPKIDIPMVNPDMYYKFVEAISSTESLLGLSQAVDLWNAAIYVGSSGYAMNIPEYDERIRLKTQELFDLLGEAYDFKYEQMKENKSCKND